MTWLESSAAWQSREPAIWYSLIAPVTSTHTQIFTVLFLFQNQVRRCDGDVTDHLANQLEACGKLHPEHRKLLLVDEPLLKQLHQNLLSDSACTHIHRHIHPQTGQLTDPKAPKAPVGDVWLQGQEVGDEGQSGRAEAVKHHTGKTGLCYSRQRLLQEPSYPKNTPVHSSSIVPFAPCRLTCLSGRTMALPVCVGADLYNAP